MTDAELTAWQTAATEECPELKCGKQKHTGSLGTPPAHSSAASSGELLTFATSQKKGMGFRT